MFLIWCLIVIVIICLLLYYKHSRKSKKVPKKYHKICKICRRNSSCLCKNKTKVNTSRLLREQVVDINLPYDIFVRIPDSQERFVPTNLDHRQYIFDYADGNFFDRFVNDYNFDEHDEPQQRGNRMFNDTQNVHDTLIQRQLKQDALQNLVTPTYTSVSLDDLYASDDKLKEIVQKIKNRNATLSGYNNKTEMEILHDTWQNGNDNVRNQLRNELKECIENGHLVCPTGTVSRILNSKYIETPEKIPKTKEMYHEDILNFSAKIRQDTPEDKFSSEFLLDAIKKEYTPLLTEEEIDDFTKDWINII
jgi:hypothetical protein